MVNVNDEFTSKYLKSADLQGRVINAKIDRVTVEEIGKDKERKLVMYFVGKEKGMALNKTNALTIGEAYGGDTDGWADQPIEIFSMKVEYQGRMVDGLRVRIPPPPKRQSAAGVQPNARDRQLAPAGGSIVDDMDDDIPFGPEWRG